MLKYRPELPINQGAAMTVTVAEYLGVNVDSSETILPVQGLAKKPEVPCPFRTDKCFKVAKAQHPVCSVRDGSGNIWIVCEHRLCATKPKEGKVTEHQRRILRMIAREIFSPSIADAEILIKREVQIPVTDTSDYKADFVMWKKNAQSGSPIGGLRAAIVEMQGGGETAGTEKMTALVKAWAEMPNATNAKLKEPSTASPLITNAWRRQQEQFLVKGSVAVLSGGRMVFCVGSLIYDYLVKRLTTVNLQNLKDANWTLALIAFVEDRDASAPECAPQSIQFKIDHERKLFTNYSSFVQALTNQGTPQTAVFHGNYYDLDGDQLLVEPST